MRNPIIRAARAAYVELTTSEAQQWYKETAIQSYLVVATVATLAVCLVENWLLEPQDKPFTPPPPELPCLPFTRIAGLLPPAKPVTHLTASVLPTSGQVIVTPAREGGEGQKSVNARELKPKTTRTRKPKTATPKQA